jgi:hypothetical protein
MAYSEEEIESTFNYICDEIEKGRALRVILRDEKMPSTSTFYLWLDSDENKSKRYARATEIRADILFEDIIEIADNSAGDTKTNSDGFEVMDAEFVQRSRLKIDARKWVLSKMNPKKYGDRTTNVLEGGDKPIQISFED